MTYSKFFKCTQNLKILVLAVPQEIAHKILNGLFDLDHAPVRVVCHPYARTRHSQYTKFDNFSFNRSRYMIAATQNM